MEECVRSGIEAAANNHTKITPELLSEIQDNIMNQICEFFEFYEEEKK